MTEGHTRDIMMP